MTNDKDSAEYTKLLNEVVTLRWKCGDQAAELAALRQPTQSDALREASEHERFYKTVPMVGTIPENSRGGGGTGLQPVVCSKVAAAGTDRIGGAGVVMHTVVVNAQSDAWQPIETAEGKIVIVYDDGFSSLVAYAADNGVYCAEDGMALSHDKLSGAIWMALPDDYPIGFMETNNDHH